VVTRVPNICQSRGMYHVLVQCASPKADMRHVLHVCVVLQYETRFTKTTYTGTHTMQLMVAYGKQYCYNRNN